MLLDIIIDRLDEKSLEFRDGVEALIDSNLKRSEVQVGVISQKSTTYIELAYMFVVYAFQVMLEGLEAWKGRGLLLGDVADTVENLKLCIPNESTKSAGLKLGGRVRDICLGRLGIELRPQLALEDVAKIRNYFYGAHLLTQCRGAALSLKKETWEQIADELFRYEV